MIIASRLWYCYTSSQWYVCFYLIHCKLSIVLINKMKNQDENTTVINGKANLIYPCYHRFVFYQITKTQLTNISLLSLVFLLGDVKLPHIHNKSGYGWSRLQDSFNSTANLSTVLSGSSRPSATELSGSSSKKQGKTRITCKPF